MGDKHEITKEEAIKLNKQMNKSAKDIVKDAANVTLQDVYTTIKKWLGIKELDTNRIDAILATVISNQMEGTPIWLFVVGASGDWKTTFVSTLEGINNTIKIDQLTSNTLATGMKDEQDLGGILQNSSHILLFLDLASLTSAHRDEKNAIWGQFRSLYDGNIYKRTGSGVNKAYENCHCTIIACSTGAIRDETLIHAQLGSRELLYDTEADPIDNHFKMRKAWENENYEEEMKKEFREIVTNFIRNHPLKEIEIPEDIYDYLCNEADRIAILRAGGAIDKAHRELINPIEPEVPTRAIKQFKRLYKSLKSLDENYPDEKAKQIITHIVNSSGNKVRQMVLSLLENQFDKKWKISEVQHELKLGRNSVKAQLEQLWNLGVLFKDVVEERIGGYFCQDYDGSEHVKGGRIEEIAYYQFNINR
jgi:predicted DNA-binding transcriptional regulator